MNAWFGDMIRCRALIWSWKRVVDIFAQKGVGAGNILTIDILKSAKQKFSIIQTWTKFSDVILHYTLHCKNCSPNGTTVFNTYWRSLSYGPFRWSISQLCCFWFVISVRAWYLWLPGLILDTQHHSGRDLKFRIFLHICPIFCVSGGTSVLQSGRNGFAPPAKSTDSRKLVGVLIDGVIDCYTLIIRCLQKWQILVANNSTFLITRLITARPA